MQKIIKAVFPVAGFGTRFLPVTKASPKEMLPVVDKPLIQYAVEEAVAAGITDIIFVTSHGKRAIEDHFDRNAELESKLIEQKEFELLESITNIVPSRINCIYIRQSKPCGLGHAILCAASLISDDEYFAVLLADDLIYNEDKSCLSQMVEKFTEYNKPIIAVQKIDMAETKDYGVVGFDKPFNTVQKITQIVEKPALENAPSNFGVVGRYILPSNIFKILQKIQPGTDHEIQLTDAIAKLIETGVYAYEFSGVRYDCGNKLGYLNAIVHYALKHKTLGEPFKQLLKNLEI